MLLAIALPLAALGLTGLVIVAMVKEVRQRQRSQPDPYAHACPTGTFSPEVTVTVLLEDADDVIAAFDGLHCDRCGARLTCRACGKFPKIGDVINLDPDFERKPYRCCPAPDYDLAPAETPEEWKELN